MTENDFLQLVRRWQDPGTWNAVESAGTNAAELQLQADKLGSDARFMLDRGDVAAAQELKAEADHLRNCAAVVRQQRFERVSEFMQIENWVREHRQELLEFVPIPKFDGDPSEAIRDLRRLESRIRAGDHTGRAADVVSPRRTKPRMPVQQVDAHWREILASGNRDLVATYLTLAEIELAKMIGCSRGTLRKCESFQNRGIAMREFNRENG